MIRALIFFLVFCVGFFTRVRSAAYANLRIAFGPAGTGLYFRSLAKLADNVYTVLKACRRSSKYPKIRFDTSVLSSLSVPPPWVCVTGHIGVFELMTRIMEHLNMPLTVVVRPPRNWVLKKILAFVRHRIGTEFIEKNDIVRGTFQSMSQGKSVAIFADHNAGYHGVFLPFLGFSASTTRLPAVLALRFQKPVVMGFIRKEGTEFVSWVEKVIIPRPLAAGADPTEEEMRILREMNDVYTDVIRRYPEEWFWFHRRWKTRPGDREAHILR